MGDEKPTPARAATVPLAISRPESAHAETVPEALPALQALTALPAPADVPPEAYAALDTRRDRFFNACHETLASIGASQAAIASDMTAIMLEWSGLARTNLTAAADSAAALLHARNLTDAVEIQLGFARRSIQSFVGGSTRLGELGLKLANDAAVSLKSPFPTT